MADSTASPNKKAPRPPVNVSVQLASGEVLASVQAMEAWTISDVIKELAPHIGAGKAVASLIFGDKVLQADKTLSDYGLKDTCTLQATIVAVPVLHLFDACTSEELAGDSGRRDHWACGGASDSNIVRADVKYKSVTDAPAAAKDVAEELRAAFSSLSDEQVCMSSEGGDSGEVIIISNPGRDAKAACLQALAIVDTVDDVDDEDFGTIPDKATITERDWKQHLRNGFNMDPDDDDDEDRIQGFLDMTKVMAEKLSDGFEFNFNDDVVCAPVIYGGYTSDGSIVGVLSSRVWT